MDSHRHARLQAACGLLLLGLAATLAAGAAGLDDGPRAAATPVDAALAARGKKLFTQKNCFTCHKMDARLIGPPLGAVPKERTAAWMMSMIQHPTEMTEKDPVARQLFHDYKVQMVLTSPVKEDEARALVEYIKSGGK